MYFGKYLVDEKILKEEELIACVLEQVNSLPSSLESIIELNLCDNNKLVEIIVRSIESNEDILTAYGNIVDSAIDIEKILEYQANKSKSLIDIILAKTDVQKNILIEAFSKYESIPQGDVTQIQDDKESVIESNKEESSDEDESLINAAALESLKELQGGDISLEDLGISETKMEVSVEPVDSASVVEEEEDVEISAAALESLRELTGGENPDLLALEKVTQQLKDEPVTQVSDEIRDYIEIYSEAKNKKLNKIIRMIDEASKGDSDIGNYFNSLYKELHIIKGAAVLVGAKYSKKLIEIWEIIIDKMFSMSNDEIKAWVFSYLDNLKSSVSLLWEIRGAISTGDDEESYMKNDDSRDKYLSSISSLKNIISEIS